MIQNNHSLSRRDFLKLSGLLSLWYAAPQSIIHPQFLKADSSQENFLIILFDAWSAANIPLLGYGRQTTPNLERLAEKAIVYHNHYSLGHFTTPGTASLLSGTAPWTHGAFEFHGTIKEELADHNIFNAFPHHHRVAYTHNPLADTILQQFLAQIDDFTPFGDLYLDEESLVNTLFKNDIDVASIAWNRSFVRHDDGHAYSLYLSQIIERINKQNREELEQLIPNFPMGLPYFQDFGHFTLEHGIDWLSNLVGDFPQPFMGYFHFLPPHYPYNTRIEFLDDFVDDGYQPLEKPLNFFQENKSKDVIATQHRWYDEFILYVDAEFDRLYRQLEEAGILENTWLILTSDHGEIFERGIIRHEAPVYYRPAINVPLVIFPPGQDSRVDIYEKTSAIDILPTLAQISGEAIPSWAEGKVMAPFANPAPSEEEDITTVYVYDRAKNGEVTKASFMIVRGDFKLMWFFGYEEIETENRAVIELYDLANDPEELHNLYPTEKSTADELLGVLREKLEKLNKESL